MPSFIAREPIYVEGRCVAARGQTVSEHLQRLHGLENPDLAQDRPKPGAEPAETAEAPAPDPEPTPTPAAPKRRAARSAKR